MRVPVNFVKLVKKGKENCCFYKTPPVAAFEINESFLAV